MRLVVVAVMSFIVAVGVVMGAIGGGCSMVWRRLRSMVFVVRRFRLRLEVCALEGSTDEEEGVWSTSRLDVALQRWLHKKSSKMVQGRRLQD